MMNDQVENENQSAYEKAAKDGVDPRCIPQKLDGPVPEHDDIVYPDYPQSDHDTWKYLYDKLLEFLPGRACDEYMEGTSKLNFTSEKIPYLKNLSNIFYETTGWKVARVPGLIHEQNFFLLMLAFFQHLFVCGADSVTLRKSRKVNSYYGAIPIFILN